MRRRLQWSLALAAGLVGACGGQRATELRTTEYPMGTRWNTTLATPAAMVGAAQVNGSAWMAQGGNEEQTRAEIAIENAIPGGRHPWHVHQGQCGDDRGILGPADRYGLLEVGGNGKATQSATLPVPVPRAGQYMVNVHASPENLGTIVACGNLSPPVR
jgi:hypothetical protein